MLGIRAGLDVDETRLHHSSPVARRDVHDVGDAVGLAVVHDDHAHLKLGGSNHAKTLLLGLGGGGTAGVPGPVEPRLRNGELFCRMGQRRRKTARARPTVGYTGGWPEARQPEAPCIRREQNGRSCLPPCGGKRRGRRL